MNDSQPQSHDQQAMSRRERIDRASDEFERRFKAGEQPHIEDFLDRAEAADRELLLAELLRVELELRHAAGEPVRGEEYQGRFSEAETVVESALESFDERRGSGSGFTGDHQAPDSPTPEESQSDDTTPEAIGRFQPLKILGQGAFGVVYLARDPKLNRMVALKVPRLERFESDAAIESFIREAQHAAQLEHRGIVQVHDVQHEPGLIYIVQQYVNGGNLLEYVKQGPLTPRRAAELLIAVAEAVGYAHQRQFVHRDLKPANLLLDTDGKPYVADFGLAVHDTTKWQHVNEYAGSPAYMSPEQMRGESHRLDGRSDIWSLGVILYELLAGRRPFGGGDRKSLREGILISDPASPSEVDPNVPGELSRICLVCLAKRAIDRYPSTAELIDDLRHWLDDEATEKSRQHDSGEAQSSQAAPKKIMPQGLRSFEAGHADFYLDLLPGPHDREGLPGRVRFWTQQMEEKDADETFAVGLMYGPSGCGKSSLVKAGIIPRLADNVLPIYVEATAADTEVRLIKALRKRCPELSPDDDLTQLFDALRRQGGSCGRKVVVVIDQFEQWLHAHVSDDDSQIIPALRHCDGSGVQCVVLVRDDFWLSATRFMQALEIPLLEGRNSALVDLFDIDHALKVLAAFGRAYGKLPDLPAEPSEEQKRFLEHAVSGLADAEGKVVCVRLAVFAEMMKGRPWTEASLMEVGGIEGVGVTFLEETFSSKTAPPTHRLHQNAIRAVLKELLPEQGTDIKGQMRSYEELLAASGYGERRRDFDALLGILDGEVRLVTPTEPDEDPSDASSQASKSHATYYQLAHDYLVPSLRDWLTRKQKETRQGRAELALSDRAVVWQARPENRQLPSLWQWLQIRRYTRTKSWTEPQRLMMAKAGRVHGLRWTAGLTVVALLVIAGVTIRHRVLADQARIQQENELAQRETQARGLVDALGKADIGQIDDLIQQLDAPLREIADPLLRQMHDDADPLSDARLRAALALLPVEASLAAELQDHLLAAAPAEAPVIVDQLAKAKQGEKLAPALWEIVNDEQETGARRLRAACGLATFEPENPDWETVAQAVAKELVSVRPAYVSYWQASLRDAGKWLAESLGNACRDEELGPTQRSLATDLVADYAADSPQVLSDVIQYANAEQFALFYPLLEKHAGQATETLTQLVQTEPERSWQDPPLEDWEPVVPTAITTIEMAHGLVAERFAFCQTLPLADFEPLCEQLKPSGYRPRRVRLFQETDTTLVAAVWARDGADWQWLIGDAETIRKRDQELAQQQFQAVDVTAFVSQSEDDEGPPPQFAALWLKASEGEARNQLLVGTTNEQYEAAAKALDAGGYKRRLAWSVLPQQGGEQLVSGVWSKAEVEQQTYAQAGNEYTGELHLGLLQTDVQLVPAAKPATNRQRFTQQQETAEAALAENPEDVPARFSRAVAAYRLDDLEQAAQDLAWLLEKQPAAVAFRYQALTLARQNKAEEAQAALKKGLEAVSDVGLRSYYEALVSFHLGDKAEALEKLDAACKQHADDADVLLWVARAYALMAGADEKNSEEHQSKALDVLQDAMDAGYSSYATLQTQPDLETLRDSEQFQQLLQLGKLDRQFTALWERSSEYESRELHGLGPAEQQARSRQLIAEGFRPACFAGIGIDGNIVAASVWHRPLIAEDVKEELAKRQANAAVALLKMKQAEAVWPYLAHRPDPRGRSYLIHRLAPLAADPEVLIAKLEDDATEVSIRRALLLSLGELTSEQFPDESRKALAPKLLDLYKAHPDAGIHAASQWLLRQWGAEESIAQATAALQESEPARAKREADAPRGWYVNGQGQTMVVVQGGEFLMGSLSTDPERQPDETLHRKQIGRRYALSATAVTRAQYRTFQQDWSDDAYDTTRFPQVRDVVKTDDSPITAVTWYEAAAYCNWLSEQEGIDKEQWCYERNEAGKFGPKMKPKANYLSLTGYRLPSEAEWEFACRAGATTRRYYGHSEAMLDAYAWFSENSERRTWPVGLKKPNDWGLFDMHGNVWTWCHNRSSTYGDSREDEGDSETVEDNASRVLRGGSFLNFAPYVRSADRYTDRPNNRNANFGFRPARTLTP